MADPVNGAARILILGGGIAGMETLLALLHVGGERVSVRLVSAEPDLTYLPELVEEPFTAQPARRRELASATQELGAEFRLGEVAAVDSQARAVRLGDGSTEAYEDLVVCIGGRRVPAYEQVQTLATHLPVDVDGLLRLSAADDARTLALIVPPRIAWSLPLYEFALLSRRRAEELGVDVRIRIFTPEAAPLGVFGTEASEAAAELLRARDIDVVVRARVRQEAGGTLVGEPGHEPIEYSQALALPEIAGPAVDGLPADEQGFIPTDEYGRVRGVEHVYAAGDGTTFPIKQGGVACQQADAIALHIAAAHGADVEPVPFRPVLRGKLITGAESLFMRGAVAGGGGEGAASADALWRPASKVAGRYLGPWLTRGLGPSELDDDPLIAGETGLSAAEDWHEIPMALDPLGQAGLD